MALDMTIENVAPIKRTQDLRTYRDGRKTRVCYGPHNPHAFSRNDKDFIPIDLPYINTDGKSTIGNILLKDRNVRSVAVRQDLKSSKLIGIRPDNAQDGRVQFEITPLALKLGALEGSLGAGKVETKSPVMTDFGPFVATHTRQGARIFLPYDGKFDSFRMSFRIDTEGLYVNYVAGLDEYWFHRMDTGELFCRLRKPDIFDLLGANPVWGDLDIDPLDLIGHDLIQNTDGSFLYTKYSKDALSKVGIPAFLVDGDIYYSTTADGFVVASSAVDWDAVHDETDGYTTNSALTFLYSGVQENAGTQYIQRSWLCFDSSGVGTVASCDQKMHGYTWESGDVAVMKGTQGAALTTSDFDSFSGSLYGSLASLDASGWNTISYNATGIADIVDGITKVCCRNKSYDYDDVDPTTNTYIGGFRSADYADVTYDPHLEITESAETTYTKTTSIDALIQKTGIAQTVSLDAMIQKEILRMLSIDSMIQDTMSATMSTDALIQAVKSGTISIDALVALTGTDSVSIDALIEAVKTGTLSIDAMIQVTGTTGTALDAIIVSAVGSQVFLDALIEAVKAGAISLDAYIAIAGSGTVSMDALIEAVKTGAVSLDAMIQSTGTGSLDLDAMVQASYAKTVSIDAFVQATKTGAVSIDALVELTGTSGVAIDALVSAVSTGSISIDALVAITGTSAAALDAMIQATKSGAISMDALIRVFITSSTTLDALVAMTGTGSALLDAYVADGMTGSAALDALVAEVRSGGILMDAIIREIGYVLTYRSRISSSDRCKSISAAGRIKTLSAPGRVRLISSN